MCLALKKNFILFIYFWPGWVCVAARDSLVLESGSCSPAVVHRLLAVVAPLVLEHRLRRTGFSKRGSLAGEPRSVVVVHGLSCSTACGIFPDQGILH